MYGMTTITTGPPGIVNSGGVYGSWPSSSNLFEPQYAIAGEGFGPNLEITDDLTPFSDAYQSYDSAYALNSDSVANPVDVVEHYKDGVLTTNSESVGDLLGSNSVGAAAGAQQEQRFEEAFEGAAGGEGPGLFRTLMKEAGDALVSLGAAALYYLQSALSRGAKAIAVNMLNRMKTAFFGKTWEAFLLRQLAAVGYAGAMHIKGFLESSNVVLTGLTYIVQDDTLQMKMYDAGLTASAIALKVYMNPVRPSQLVKDFTRSNLYMIQKSGEMTVMRAQISKFGVNRIAPLMHYGIDAAEARVSETAIAESIGTMIEKMSGVAVMDSAFAKATTVLTIAGTKRVAAVMAHVGVMSANAYAEYDVEASKLVRKATRFAYANSEATAQAAEDGSQAAMRGGKGAYQKGKALYTYLRSLNDVSSAANAALNGTILEQVNQLVSDNATAADVERAAELSGANLLDGGEGIGDLDDFGEGEIKEMTEEQWENFPGEEIPSLQPLEVEAPFYQRSSQLGYNPDYFDQDPTRLVDPVEEYIAPLVSSSSGGASIESKGSFDPNELAEEGGGPQMEDVGEGLGELPEVPEVGEGIGEMPEVPEVGEGIGPMPEVGSGVKPTGLANYTNGILAGLAVGHQVGVDLSREGLTEKGALYAGGDVLTGTLGYVGGKALLTAGYAGARMAAAAVLDVEIGAELGGPIGMVAGVVSGMAMMTVPAIVDSITGDNAAMKAAINAAQGLPSATVDARYAYQLYQEQISKEATSSTMHQNDQQNDLTMAAGQLAWYGDGQGSDAYDEDSLLNLVHSPSVAELDEGDAARGILPPLPPSKEPTTWEKILTTAKNLTIPFYIQSAMELMGEGMSAIIKPLNEAIRGYTPEQQKAAYIEIMKMKYWQNASRQLQLKQDAHQQRSQIQQIRKLLTVRAGVDLNLPLNRKTGDFEWPDAPPSRTKLIQAYLKKINWTSTDMGAPQTSFQILTQYKANLDAQSAEDMALFGTIESPIDYTPSLTKTPTDIFDQLNNSELNQAVWDKLSYSALFEERALFRRAHRFDDPPTYWDETNRQAMWEDEKTAALRLSDSRGETHASDPVVDPRGKDMRNPEFDHMNESSEDEDESTVSEMDEGGEEEESFHDKAVDRKEADDKEAQARSDAYDSNQISAGRGQNKDIRGFQGGL